MESLKHIHFLESRSRAVNMATLGAIAVLTCTGIQNIDAVADAHAYFNDGEIVPEVAGCDDFNEAVYNDAFTLQHQTSQTLNNFIEKNEPQDSSAAFTAASVEISAANNTDIVDINAFDTITTLRSFFDSEPIETYTSPETGITFTFFTNTDHRFTLHPERINQLFLLPFAEEITYDDPYLAYTMNCLSDKFLIDKEYAGAVYPVYIHGQPDACFVNLALYTPPNDTSIANCQSNGFTPPQASIDILAWKPLELLRSTAVTITEKDGHSTELRMRRLLAHELAGHGIFRFAAPHAQVHKEPDEDLATIIEHYITPFLDSVEPPVIYD